MEKKQSSVAERQGLVGRDEVAPSQAADLERTVLEERLCWTRLDLQNTLAVSADADETICTLTTMAQRMMQERDEATNKLNRLLAEVHARDHQVQGRLHPRIIAAPGPATFHATGYSIARAPTTPWSGMTAQQPAGQYYGLCRNIAPSARVIGSSTVSADPPGFHDIESSSQDSFDPDMFLASAAAESPPQDRVPAVVPGSPAPGKSRSGDRGADAEQLHLPPRKRKVDEDSRDPSSKPPQPGEPAKVRGEQRRGGAGCTLADVVNSARVSRTP